VSLGAPDARVIELGGDAVATLVLDAGTEVASPQPPPPDVTRLPGARLVAFEVARDADVTVQIGCVRSTSDRWVPGLEGVVFERALSLSLAPLAIRPQRLAREEPPSVPGATAVERHVGAALGDRRLEVVQLIAFLGERRDAVACSVLTLDHRPGGTGSSIAGSIAMVGDLREPPPPGAFARALFWSAEHPAAAMAIAAVLGILIVGGLLATRPRRRPTAWRRARAAPR
jgi:hypothetical protein